MLRRDPTFVNFSTSYGPYNTRVLDEIEKRIKTLRQPRSSVLCVPHAETGEDIFIVNFEPYIVQSEIDPSLSAELKGVITRFLAGREYGTMEMFHKAYIFETYVYNLLRYWRYCLYHGESEEMKLNFNV